MGTSNAGYKRGCYDGYKKAQCNKLLNSKTKQMKEEDAKSLTEVDNLHKRNKSELGIAGYLLLCKFVLAVFVQVKSIIGNTILCDFRIVRIWNTKEDFEAKLTNLVLQFHTRKQILNYIHESLDKFIAAGELEKKYRPLMEATYFMVCKIVT